EMKNDLEKILKAMQLGLFELQRVLDETNICKKMVSFYATHCHDGVYLVDKIESFTLPDEAFELKTLSHIINETHIMLKASYEIYKKRIINQVDLLENYLTIDTRRKEPRKTIQNVDVSFTSS
ncbi:13021_t:CDS:2, partial [Gigaspora rosea]